MRIFGSFLILFKFGSVFPVLISFLAGRFILVIWFRDVFREELLQGNHTFKVKKNLKFGMGLFIGREVIFFFSFFWTFFHASLSPAIEIGMIWPPVAILPVNPFQIPLLNTIVLLTSGVYVTYSHFLLLSNSSYKLILGFTLILGVYFTILQKMEYSLVSFNISDSVYGSIFFMATGFHGVHVIIGTLFLSVCFLFTYKNNFTSNNHMTFEFAIWYWHFVDVVWLFLFFFIYWWGF